MKKQKEVEIVYSKLTGKRRPPSKIICDEEPNLDLMAKAFIELYFEVKLIKNRGNKNGKLD
ncbi:hypothetical protein [Bacillus sp. JJ1474]|uniref:hypothetical protein n=1 Tax=Bacillus sp. JJ1474 TaxID=3122955 RepID=UPI0030004DC8